MHIRTTLPPCKTECRAGMARTRKRSPAPAAATFAASLSVGALSTALAGPTGGTVVEGQGAISNLSTTSTVIDQASQRLTLNWSSFNVGANESVQFNQPNSTALALNRILDQNPSQIFGSLKANGQVVLVNPNGLLIGRTAQLNVNSLVVSSLDAIDFDAASGRYRFSTSRNDVGEVINEGSITAGPGGSVTLLGGRVSNSGNIVADFGTVNLAAGRAATLDLAGDGLLRLEVNSDLLSNAGGSAAVENSGSIQAKGGQVLLTANAVQDVFTHLINNTGVVRANRIDNTGGTIRLVGPAGTVESAGTIDASGGDAVSTGGRIEMLGDHVGLGGNALVNVSGATGGGTALIGGDYQGSNPDILNASRTFVGSDVTLNADAGTQGNGGRIIVWSNDGTRFYGHLSARAGSLWGSGGFAEVSGKHGLDFAGTATLSASHGDAGSLLLDPDDLTITRSNTDNDTGASGGGTVIAYADTPATASIGDTVVEGLLANGNIVLQANNSISSEDTSDINVGAANGHSLTLESKGSITLAGNIQLNNGAINLTSASTGGAGGITLADTASLVTNADVTLSAGTNGIDMQRTGGTAASITSGGQITFTSGGGAHLTSLSGDGIDITATGAITNDGSTTTRIASAGAMSLSGTTGIGASGNGNAIDTDVGTTLNATSASGSIYLNELNGVTLTNLSAPSGASVIRVTGGTSGTAFTAQTLTAGGDITLTTAGDILGSGAGTGIESLGGDIALDAGGVIGSVTGGALPVRIAGVNSLSAIARRSTNGVLNLRLPSAPISVATGGIQLGTTGARTGTVLLQSTGALDASAFANGAISVGSGTTVHLNATGGKLTLPVGGALTDVSPATLHLEASGDITDNDDDITIGPTTNLIFEAGSPLASKVLRTSISGQLDLTFGIARNLDLINTSTMFLGDVNVGSSADVSITVNGGIFDDGDPSGVTRVTGNKVSMNAASIGVLSNQIDTDAAVLDLRSPNGAINVRERDGVTIDRAAALAEVDIATLNGALTVSGGGSGVSGDGVILATNSSGGAPRNISIDAVVSGGVGGTQINANQALSNISFSAPISGSTVALTAGNGGGWGTITTIGAPALSGTTVDLRGASIGTVGARIQTDTTNLITNSFSGATFINEANDVNLDATATAGAIDVQTQNGAITVTQASGPGVTLTSHGAGKGITVAGAMASTGGAVSLVTSDVGGAIVVNDSITSSNTVTMTTAANGNITINDTVSGAPSATLTAGTAGNRGTVTSASTGSVNAGTVNVTAGSIGTSTSSRFNVNAGTALNATSENGGIFVHNAATAASSLNANAASNPLDVAADGSLNVALASGNGVALNASGTNRNITVNGTVDGLGSAVSLTATGAIGGAGQVFGSSLTANAASIGTSTTSLSTHVASLDTTSTGAGGTFITDADDVTLDGTATGGGTLSVKSNTGSLTVSSASGNGVTLDAGGAALTLNGAVAGNGGAVNLTASGNGGNVDLNSTVVTSGAVNVTAGSTIARGTLNLGSSNHITGGAVNVTALSIGSSGQRLNTDAASLTATSTGVGGTVFVQEDNALTSLTASADGAVNVAAGGNIGVGAVSGNGVTLSTTGTGNLSINNTVAGGVTGVTLTAAGAIQSGGGTVTGSSLAATGTAIGAGNARLLTDVSTLNTTSTGAGGTFITEANGVTLTGNAIGGGGLDVQTTAGSLLAATVSGNGIRLAAGGAGSNLTVSNAVTGGTGDVTLSATGDNGNVDVGGSVSTLGDVTITAGSVVDRGVITLGGGAGTVSGDDVVVAAESIGTSGGPLVTTARTLNATASNGGIFVRETDGLDLTANATGGTVSAETLNGALRVLGAIGDGVTLTTAGANNGISIDGAVNGGGSNVTLNAQGDGAAIALNSSVSTTATVQLTAGSGGARGAITATGGNVQATGLVAAGASIGASNARLNTTVDTMNLTTTSGGAFVSEADAVTLAGTATGGLLDVRTTNGALDVSSAVGNGVTLAAGGAHDLNLNGAVNGGVGDVTLTAGSAIVANGGTVSGALLTATAASIGTSAAHLATTVSSLNATSTSGGTFVTESDGLSLGANAAGALDVQTANGALTVTSASGNGINLAANGDGNELGVTGPVSGGASNVTLLANGAGSNLRLAGAIATTADVSLTAGTSVSRGAIIAETGNSVSANNLTAVGASIGAGSVALNTTVSSVDANATAGNIRIAETNDLTLTAINAGSGDAAVTAGGALIAGAGSNITGNQITLSAASVGTSGAHINTTANSLNAQASNGGVFVDEADALNLTAAATGGAVDVRTLNGALTAASVAGNGVTLASGGDGSAVTLIGGVSSTGNVSIAAGSTTARGAINAGDPSANVAGTTVDLLGASIGSGTARVNTAATTLNATSTNGGIYLNELNGVVLNANATGGALDVNAGGAIDVVSANGDGVSLATSTPGSAINVNSAISGRAGPVSLTASGAGSGITLNAGLTTTGGVTLTAGGAITAAPDAGINAGSLTATGSSIGTTANRLSTTVGSLTTTSTNGGMFVTETDAVTVNANATGGALDVQTTNGALTVTGAAGPTVTLTAGGPGSGIAVNGAINAGTGDVTLTAGTTASRGAITATAGGGVSGGTFTALASSIGSTATALNTTIDSLNANASSGDIAISESNGLRLTDVHAGGNVSVSSGSGDITVNVVNAGNNATLTASGGAIVDDGDDTTRLVARDVMLLARSIGGASTLTGAVLDSRPRLDISATSLDATSTSGGIFIDELDGLTSVSAHASGGGSGDIELLSATGDLNLRSIMASDTLLLSAGRNIVALPGLGVISARAAELRAGGADATAGHIGSLTQPLTLQLTAGNTLRLFVPQGINPKDPASAPATLPSSGVLTTLSLFGAPSPLAVQAGFGQFSGTGDSQFTSPAESLVRTIQNQTTVVQSVVGLDWASFDPNVSLFGTLDPAVCLPSDQRDEEKGGTGC